MRRARLIDVVLLLACAAGSASAQAPATPARDPDRGLAPELRARLALVDPALDSFVAERWAALLAPRLALVARLWSEDRLAQLAAEGWIAAELRVAPLHAQPQAEARVRGDWSVARPSVDPAAPRTLGLAPALGAWRALFDAESRLDFELFELTGDAPEFTARLRVVATGAATGAATATGAGADARAQHEALWKSVWHPGAAGPELVSLELESFEAVTLAGHARGLFRDVTRSVLGDELYQAEVAPGLDEWRATLPVTIFPGTLGHHGLAVGDADQDGLEDVYWCRPGGLPNKLLLHTRADRALDASAAGGVDLLDYSSSALFLDVDGDGDEDLVVATGSGLVFHANDGRARFTEVLRQERSLATSLAAADPDADGDLDLYVCSYVSPYEASGTPVPYHDAENGEANALLRNDWTNDGTEHGRWSLVDASAELGLGANNRRFSLAAAWADYDDDGDPDLYVANDFGRNNLYRNEGGRFRDVAAELGALDISAGMGVAWADVDDDGWLDLYVTNLHSPAGRRLTARADVRPGAGSAVIQALRQHASGNSLLRNERGGAFRDISEASGTALGRWGWGAIFLDLDNDGALDLFAPNGFVTGEREQDLDSFFWRQVVLQTPEDAGGSDESYRLGWRAVNRLVRQGWSWNGNERNSAFLNLGSATFADVSGASGLDLPDDARAAARVDWDGDGNEDLIVTNRTGPMLRFLRNEARAGAGWVAFSLRARGGTAIGARVTLETQGGRRMLRTLHAGEGYLAQSSARVHFGLGAESVRRVTVRWPGGKEEEFTETIPGVLQVLEQGSGRARPLPARTEGHTPLASTPRASETAAPARRAGARTVLPTPLALPRLALETKDGRPASLFGITLQGPRGTGQPLFLWLWSEAEPASVRGLERLAAAAEEISAAGLQVLAVNADVGEDREHARARLDALAWPFGAGFASEEALAILEHVLGTLHDHARGLVLPAGFLVDPGGRLAATYEQEIEPAQLILDLALFALEPAARRDACVPFPGRWVGPLPEPLDEKLAARLEAHGLARPAGEYRIPRLEVRAGSKAKFHYDLGVARQGEGRLAEAIALYRFALAEDPGHVQASQNLAAALHQKGEHPAALEAYRQALKLEPGNAMTRCNLGYLHLTMGNLEGARQELAALRALGSERAAELEAELLRAEPR